MLALFITRSTPTQAAYQLFAEHDDLGVNRTAPSSVAYSVVRPPPGGRPSDPKDDSSAETGSMQTTDRTATDKSMSANAPPADRHASTTGDPNGSGAGAT